MTTASDNHTQIQLQRLRQAFPLQARIEAASPAARQAYTAVLSAWLSTCTAPQAATVSASALAELVALDAVVQSASGLGCYPFSARETAIGLELDGHRLYAMCAVDALAVSALVQRSVMIDSTCSHCVEPVRLENDAQGHVREMSRAGALVEYRQLAQRHTECCNDLCPGIVFVCAACAAQVADPSTLLSLAQASAVGRDFFAFQTLLANQV